jgi:RNA polymerase sigma-70 factor (ECF subfamily)
VSYLASVIAAATQNPSRTGVTYKPEPRSNALGGLLHTDATLVEAAKRGDQSAFEALVRETHRSVYGLVYRLVGNHDDAADVMQETYLRVWRGLRRFRGDAAFETWVYRVAANAAFSHLKKRGRDPEPIDPTDLAPIEQPVPEPEEPLDADKLEKALQKLPVAMRTVLVMKDMYGFTLEEIAKQVGATEGAVKVRLFRARRKVADLMYGSDVVVQLKKKRKSS